MSSWLGCFRLDTGQGVAIARRALLGARPELLHLDFFLHHDNPFPRGGFSSERRAALSPGRDVKLAQG